LQRSGTYSADFMFSFAGILFVLIALLGSVWWASKQENLGTGK